MVANSRLLLQHSAGGHEYQMKVTLFMSYNCVYKGGNTACLQKQSCLLTYITIKQCANRSVTTSINITPMQILFIIYYCSVCIMSQANIIAGTIQMVVKSTRYQPYFSF